MRTFVAFNLPAAERARIAAALGGLHTRPLPVRWTDADGLHLTLKFLGDIEGVEVSRIDDALREIAQQYDPLELRIGGIGAFPSLRRANVLWIGVQPEPDLMSLHADVELAMSRLGYAREQKPFRPHITVGRLRTGARAPDVERMVGDVAYESTVRVATIDLMRSHLSRDGARYEPLLRPALGRPEFEE